MEISHTETGYRFSPIDLSEADQQLLSLLAQLTRDIQVAMILPPAVGVKLLMESGYSFDQIVRFIPFAKWGQT